MLLVVNVAVVVATLVIPFFSFSTRASSCRQIFDTLRYNPLAFLFAFSRTVREICTRELLYYV